MTRCAICTASSCPTAEANVRLSALAGLAQITGAVDGRFKDQVIKLWTTRTSKSGRPRPHCCWAQSTAATGVPRQPLWRPCWHKMIRTHVHRGLRLLGQTGDLSAIGRLVAFLGDPADEARLEAVVAIEALVQTDLTDDLRPALRKRYRLLSGSDRAVRQAALTIWAGSAHAKPTQRCSGPWTIPAPRSGRRQPTRWSPPASPRCARASETQLARSAPCARWPP